MRHILTAMIFIVSLYADTKTDLFQLFNNKEYKSACKLGMDNYGSYTRDEAFISLYAFSCLNADYIDRLAVPISALKYSKDARANAAYFSTVLMQKKLLYHALIDGYPISSLVLPTTDFVLSKVFDLYCQDDEKSEKNVFEYQDPKNPALYYKLYIENHPSLKKMIIEVYHDKILVERHLYW